MSHAPLSPIPDTTAALPAHIPLPPLPAAPDPDACTPASQVAAESDLPRRFLVGDLVAGSFARTSTGWRAAYAHRHASGRATLEWEGSAERLASTLSWRGHQLRSTWRGPQIPEVLRALVMPGRWDRDVTELADVYGARHALSASPHRGYLGFPDGVPMTVALPVPLSRLPALLDLHDDLARSGACPAGVRAGCALVARHLLEGAGRSASPPSQQLQMALRRGVLGFERVKVGDPPQTVACAWSYAYVARLFLRDLEPLLDALASRGLLVPGAETSPFEQAVIARHGSGAALPVILARPAGETGLRHRVINLLEGMHSDAMVAGGPRSAAAAAMERALPPRPPRSARHEPLPRPPRSHRDAGT